MKLTNTNYNKLRNQKLKEHLLFVGLISFYLSIGLTKEEIKAKLKKRGLNGISCSSK